MNAQILFPLGRSAMYRTVLPVLVVLGLWSTSALALDAVSAPAPTPEADAGLRVALSVPDGRVQTGDRKRITAIVTNTTGHPVNGITLLLGLVDVTPGQPVPLGLETWTADAESVALPPLAAGASASAAWNLVMIQPGPLGVYASVIAGPSGTVESSPMSVLQVRDVRVLNPSDVLPVAVGEPLLLLGLVIGARRGGTEGRGKTRP